MYNAPSSSSIDCIAGLLGTASVVPSKPVEAGPVPTILTARIFTVYGELLSSPDIVNVLSLSSVTVCQLVPLSTVYS